jgi:hypothetical protein
MWIEGRKKVLRSGGKCWEDGKVVDEAEGKRKPMAGHSTTRTYQKGIGRWKRINGRRLEDLCEVWRAGGKKRNGLGDGGGELKDRRSRS